jgi:hypothetical protein
MKHRHEKWIHLMADGVRIERKQPSGWVKADMCCFDWNDVEFRVAPNQPADEEGWITWYGGENPAVGKRVDVFFRLGNRSNLPASNFDWRHTGGVGDIVAYRIAKQVKKWRWMYIINKSSEEKVSALPQFTPYFATEEEAKRWCNAYQRLGPRQDWTEVECG